MHKVKAANFNSWFNISKRYFIITFGNSILKYLGLRCSKGIVGLAITKDVNITTFDIK